MNKYVFFTNYIGGMGGGQLYVLSKSLYLKDRGWDVEIYYSVPSQKILLHGLRQFGCYCILPKFPSFFYSLVQREKKLKSITSHIKGDYETIVIESNKISLSTWAEGVSSILKAKHIVYPLDEDIKVVNSGMQDFLKFKYQRREMAGILETSLQNIFAPFSPIGNDSSFWLRAYFNDPVADIDISLLYEIDKTKYDFVVGCLSRLNKPFVRYAIYDFYEYVRINNNKRYLLLLIGDAGVEKELIDSYYSMFNNVKDYVDIIVTGYLYPIPIKLLRLCDVFISSAGSAHVCKRSGVPTITYDANDHRPIGILGRTTESYVYRKDNEKPQDFSFLMHQVLDEHKYCINPIENKDLPDYSEHMAFIEQSSKEYSYYNIGLIHVENKEERIQYMGILLLGEPLYKWCFTYVIRFRRFFVSLIKETIKTKN